MSYGIETVNVNKKLKLDKRANSANWYARLTLDDGKCVVLSTRTDDLEQAQERALKLYYETQARIANQLPAQTRKFKHVAEHAIKRMQDELNEGSGSKLTKTMSPHCVAGSFRTLAALTLQRSTWQL